MRYIRQKTGLERLNRNSYSYKPGTVSNYDNLYKEKKEVSEDTKIRRDIHCIICSMANQNKGTIEIEVFLTNKYPNYSEYIIKMINQHFTKLNKSKTSDSEKGDER